MLRVSVSLSAAVVVYLLCVRSVCGVRGRSRDTLVTQGAARGYFAPQPPHYAYLGLPYAAAPTGHRRRYKTPEPPTRWDGLFEATHRVKCVQRGGGEENCLVVNVFTPEQAASSPVLVVVHGGNFQTGWGSTEVPTRWLNENFVVVTFNYRLGILGFLCLREPSAPGNVGLKDQIAALYWIQRNIKRFGGDPGDVTVYGEGSAAEAVQLLLLSGLAEGLVHKVILESGSVMSPSKLTYHPFRDAYETAIKLGYKDVKNLEALVKFYKKLSGRNLTNIQDTFLPCVESQNEQDHLHSLINMDPKAILQHGNFQMLPMILIYKNSDASTIIEENKNKLTSIPDSFESLLPNNLYFENNETRERIAELVKEFYFVNNNNMLKSYSDYFQDILYVYPIIKFALLYSSKSPYPVYLLKILDKPYNDVTDEISSQRATTVNDYLYETDSNVDEKVAQTLVMLMKNFIKFSDPTPLATSTVPTIWQPVNVHRSDEVRPKAVPLMLLERTLVMTTIYSQHLQLWNHIYDNFYRPVPSVDNEFSNCCY